jgi:hypothetical protein
MQKTNSALRLLAVVVSGALFVEVDTLAATINASSCSQSAVQAAINSALDGDTVRVPAGSCTWTGGVSILNKTLTLAGAGSGAGGTQIVYGGTGHALLSIDAGSRTGRMDVSGFWFFGGAADNWTGTAIVFSGPVGWKNLRIHHNLFDGNKQWSISGKTGTYGVIDHNTFQGSAHGITMSGRGNSDWSTLLTLGTADFFFIEDNAFNWNDWYGNTGAVAADFVNGGRIVFRNNSVKQGFFETHDRARSGWPSANAWEVYRNTFWTNSTKWKGIDLTAGTGVAWGNAFTGNWSYPIGGMDYKTAQPGSIPQCDGNDPADQNVAGQSGWRCQYQIGTQGYGSTATSYPAYFWNNLENGSATGMVVTAGASHVVAGRDYFNNGTTPKPGYVPYTYPHPLTQDGDPQPSTLAAPTNLRVVP